MTRRYDDSDRRQLASFVHGDAGFEWAIAQVVARVPTDAGRVLHYGCGIGWLTAEVKRHRRHASVTGIDPSPTAVAAAQALFAEDGLSFEVGDLEALGRGSGRLADVLIVSGDYGMLLGQTRSELVRAVAAATADGAVVVLHLRGAGDSQLPDLAVDLGGRIAAQSASSAGPETQRVVAIQRGTAVRPGPGRARRVATEARRRRRERVSARLGLRVAPAGTLIPNRPGPAVLIVTPNPNSAFETFINAQIEGMPVRVEVLFGIPPNSRDVDGRSFIPRWARALKRVTRKPLGMRVDGIDAFFLGRFFRHRGIAVVLAEYGPTGVDLFETCRRHSMPLVTQFLGYDAYHHGTLERLREGYSRLLAEESATVAVSQDMQGHLYDLGARPGSVHWVACGADPDRFIATRPDLNPAVFLAAGRFIEKKAPHLTLLAFSRLVKDVPGARLQMVGGGPLLDACRQLADALGVAASVEFLGFISHEDLAGLMARARAFVQHSVTDPSGDSEGTPVAILEAGAAGLPVVSTRHGGIPEIVVDGVTGLLVEPGDVDSMADCMRRLATDPALAGRLGAAARSHIVDHFAQSAMLDRFGQVLRDAMAIPILDERR